jgi:hypothetical protein
LFALAMAVRVPLVLSEPSIHGGDSLLRLARSDELFIGYWLPLPQVLVFLARAVQPDPVWARLAFALVGALVPAALARAMAPVAGAGAAACAGALLALHPLWAFYSLVPYQEGLMTLFLLLGAESLVRRREAGAAAWMGLACLCRYETWIAAAMAALPRWRRPLRAASFVAVPLLWTAAHAGFGPRGSYVLDLDPAVGHWTRLAFLVSKLREYSGDALPVLAVLGAVAAARARDRRWIWGALFAAAVMGAAMLGGHETPPGSGRISERMAHLPAAALCALAGWGLWATATAARGRARWPARGAAVVVVAILGWQWHGRLRNQVREAAADPSLRLAVQVARFAHGELPEGGRLAVAGAPVPQEALEAYVRKVAAGGGDVAAAREIASRLAALSPDLVRIAAHLPRRPGTAVPVGSAPAQLVAVFDDTSGARGCGPARARFEAGTRGVTLCDASVQGTNGAR